MRFRTHTHLLALQQSDVNRHLIIVFKSSIVFTYKIVFIPSTFQRSFSFSTIGGGNAPLIPKPPQNIRKKEEDENYTNAVLPRKTDMLPSSAVFQFLWEINSDLVKDGASVRTYGRLTSYKPEGSKAILTGQQSSAQFHVSVQTTLVEPFQPILGALYFVLGDIEKTDGLHGVILCARALTCIDGVDLTLMHQAIMEQRCFFKQREPL